MDTTDAELRYLVAVLFLDRLSFRRRTRNRKQPLLQISLKLPYKTLYVSGEESQKQNEGRKNNL
jgi:hypothetical protein